MSKYNFIKVLMLLGVAAVVMPMSAVTIINTPHGQFSFVNGNGACTVVDLHVAAQLLALAPAEWKNITPDQLTQLVSLGVGDYGQIIIDLKKKERHWFQASEAAPYFQALQLTHELLVYAAEPDVSDSAAVRAAGLGVLTFDTISLLPAIIAESDKPVCGIWTNGGYSHLICYKDGAWLFFDSHRQSMDVKEGALKGASLYVFDSAEEFLDHLKIHYAFKIKVDSLANVTLLHYDPLLVTPGAKVLLPKEAALSPVEEFDVCGFQFDRHEPAAKFWGKEIPVIDVTHGTDGSRADWCEFGLRDVEMPIIDVDMDTPPHAVGSADGSQPDFSESIAQESVADNTPAPSRGVADSHVGWSAPAVVASRSAHRAGLFGGSLLNWHTSASESRERPIPAVTAARTPARGTRFVDGPSVDWHRSALGVHKEFPLGAASGALEHVTNIADIVQDYDSKTQELFLYGKGIRVIDGAVFSQIAKKWSLLKTLKIIYNDLTDVPVEIGELHNLEELDLHHNAISKLPFWALAKLRKLRMLTLYGNPLANQSDWPEVKVRLLKDHPNMFIL